MAKYTVMERSFIDNHLREEGEVIEYDPPEGTTVGGNLVPFVASPPAPEPDTSGKGGK